MLTSPDGDRLGNCKPGTVVYTGIVMKQEFDFCKPLLANVAYYTHHFC